MTSSCLQYIFKIEIILYQYISIAQKTTNSSKEFDVSHTLQFTINDKMYVLKYI